MPRPNLKRLRDVTGTEVARTTRNSLADKVKYEDGACDGQPPSEAGHGTAAEQQGDVPSCRDVGICTWEDASDLLRRGVEQGLYCNESEGFPTYIWSVKNDDLVLEAQITEKGTYRGHPMPQHDPMRDLILQKWAQNA